jgi:hypothetical protein
MQGDETIDCTGGAGRGALQVLLKLLSEATDAWGSPTDLYGLSIEPGGSGSSAAATRTNSGGTSSVVRASSS